MTVVEVPAGEFPMGSPEGVGSSDEQPVHQVYLDAYWVDMTEVTNRQFTMFVQATRYRTAVEIEGAGNVDGNARAFKLNTEGADWQHPEGPDSSIAERADFPVVQVTREDAQAYCQWAGGRLPTEAEWEKAAVSTDGRWNPWGNQLASCEVALVPDDRLGGAGCGQGAKPWSVGSLPAGASPYGALDMVGNVSEVVADWYDAGYYAKSPARNPQGPATGDSVIWRGQGFGDGDSKYDYASRIRMMIPFKGAVRMNWGGFRCVVPDTAPETVWR